MTRDEVNKFEKIQTQLDSLHSEITSLAKKSHNDAINKFKLGFVNNSLVEANAILTDKYKPFDDFQQFSEDDLPSNSDVTMIIGQYLNCMEKLRADNVELSGGRWFWVTDDKVFDIRTSQPQKTINK